MRERVAAVRANITALPTRVQSGIQRAIAEDHTPHEIALSFAFGVLVTALPTAGTAFVIFALVAYFVDRANKLALVASLVVFNPPVKWAVYGASFWLGSFLLGPVPGASVSDVSLDAGFDIVLRQLLGNGVLAVALAALGYVVALSLVQLHRRREFAVPDVAPADD
ncbi:hypothetical protein C455_11493 [Haloferax larsenii JCM 13917]|nr:DUF2062 domain-containing protein [Haloferax larsenii]ELZ78304.1 hypothetical protein C455_11493 [Haloferax larsenii JCM 13917]